MTDESQEQVTQADRDAAKEFIFLWNRDLATDDDLSVAFARHRLTRTEPQDASRPSEGFVGEQRDFIDYHRSQLLNYLLPTANKLKNWPTINYHIQKLHEGGATAISALRTQEARPEAVEALRALEAAATLVIEWLDRLNDRDGTALGGPQWFELGRSITKARAALSEQPHTDAAGMRELLADFQLRARQCRTNRDAYDEKAASVWEFAAKAVEEKLC